MNNPSPLVPQGSLLEEKNKGRARVKIAVFFVLAIHGIGLLALLMAGCHSNDSAGIPKEATNSVAQPFDTASTAVDTNYVPPAPASNAYVAPAPATSVVAPAAGTATDYKIVKGDTLGDIAKRNKVTLKALMEANAGVDATKLQIGQTIHIPAPVTPAVAPSTTGTPAPDLATGEQLYTVKSGDSLTTIAKLHSTTIKALRTANGLKTDALKVGQKLKIPAAAAAPAAAAPGAAH